METSAKIDEVIALGKALVAILRRKRREPDLLAEWMAHHVAECLVAARRAKGRSKVVAEDRCVATILQLWRHRSALPDGRRPFEKFEPILSTLARLDPEHDHWFYFDGTPHWNSSAKRKPQKPGSVEQLAELAANLDHAARVLIEFILNEATAAADEPITRRLLKSGFDDESDLDIETIRRLLETKDIGTDMDETLRATWDKRLNDRIERLRMFLSIGRIALREYQGRLRRLRQKQRPAKKKPRRGKDREGSSQSG